ncbi:MAG: hypothetical protein M3015_14620 [Bacteroidota bacterium]|nr:hypothetical protein [Bacteroidota bacterium]
MVHTDSVDWRFSFYLREGGKSYSLKSFSQSKIPAEQQLQFVLDDWSLKVATNSIDSIIYYWADDAIILDHGKNVNGKSAIRQMMQNMSNIAFRNNNASHYCRDINIFLSLFH